MNELKVNLNQCSYPIYIDNQHLSQLTNRLATAGFSKLAFITDETVDSFYGDMMVNLLQTAGLAVAKVVITGGEANKNLAAVEYICQRLLELGLDRGSALLALGGGIVGDITGFAAASYMRGISFIQIPTTLLAQVDSSVGGKTGVNLPGGKNLIGAFWQPQTVFIDVSFLKTLTDREFKTGIAEVIKYGIIKDADLFAYLEQNREAILNRHPESLLAIINRCCSIKATIVAQDEKENGERALLNLGHTFGHAFESLSSYNYNHGEAVAAGIVYAARLSSNLSLLTEDDVQRITLLIAEFGLPTQVTGLAASAVVAAMHRDKKSRQGQLQLVLPTTIGAAILTNEVSDAIILQVLDI